MQLSLPPSPPHVPISAVLHKRYSYTMWLIFGSVNIPCSGPQKTNGQGFQPGKRLVFGGSTGARGKEHDVLEHRGFKVVSNNP